MTTNTPPHPEVAWAKRRRQVVLALGLAMLLYVGLTVWSGWSKLWKALSGFPVATHLTAVLGLVLLGLLLRALRWEYYNRYLGWNVPAKPNLLVFLASFAFTATPGKAGEVVKSFLLRSRYNVKITESASVLMMERLQDLLAVLVLAAGGLAMIASARWYFVLCALIVLGVTVLLISETLHNVMLRTLQRWQRLQPIAEKLDNFFRVGRSLFRLKPFAVGLFLALLAWACEGYALHLLFQGFQLKIPMLTSFFIYGMATVIGALSMLPGGLGGFEASMLFLLNTLKVSSGIAVASTVLIRFCTLWTASLLGMLFLGVWEFTYGKEPAEDTARSEEEEA
ncbi:MAG: flippase-like domain-containing protein [Deltaproteobacteria bacterium]|nr:MAG: flippase-like domain-containing protein [Deltaproteobacteria bacterium]